MGRWMYWSPDRKQDSRHRRTCQCESIARLRRRECFIDEEFVKKNDIDMTPMCHPARIFNVDGTENQNGTIKATIDLLVFIKDIQSVLDSFVCGLGKIPIILGEPGLKSITLRSIGTLVTSNSRVVPGNANNIVVLSRSNLLQFTIEWWREVLCIMIRPEERIWLHVTSARILQLRQRRRSWRNLLKILFLSVPSFPLCLR